MLKKIAISISTTLLLLGAVVIWLFSFVPSDQQRSHLQTAQAEDLSYLQNRVELTRGRILAVLTNVETFGNNKMTGYELTELSRAYWVFAANGFVVDFASPNGGKSPAILDADDMGAYDYAFLNDQVIQKRVANAIKLSEVNPADYVALYFVGGKGTMFDFPEDTAIQYITREMYQSGKVISAVCHGPAALINVQLDNGAYLLAGKKVTGFTNEEELFLIPGARNIFPFLLQDKLIARGALFQEGAAYLENVIQDGKLITGQNPWSTWKLAEMVILELGYEPIPRIRTAEENTIDLLKVFEARGYGEALQFLSSHQQDYESFLVLMHSIIAISKWQVSKAFKLLMLANKVK